MSTTLDREEIVRRFQGCIHCSQVVIEQWADELDLDMETAMRMAAPLGGGCFKGDVCGCVTGALLAIGARYGHCEIGDTDGNARMVAKTNEFCRKFAERTGSTICRELTGYDFSKPGQMEEAALSGTLIKKCPEYVNTALEILDEIM